MKSLQKTSCSIIGAAIFSCAALFTSSHAHAAELSIEIKGVTSETGSVLVALYDKADMWMKTAIKYAKVSAKKEGVSVVLKDLPEGEYAASIYHDENDNGKFDTNALGMPIEPYAFSNDASGNFGPPSYEQAKFKVDAVKKSIVINFK
jgi:uncharacterized protein (DUF2141 family)